MSESNLAIEIVLGFEGDQFTDYPEDPGGATKFGISLRFLQATGLKYDFLSQGTINKLSIELLTHDQAKNIYLQEFWNPQPYDKINNQQVANYIFSMCVNIGGANAHRCAQRAVWAQENQRTIILDDGVLGSKTLDEINHCGMLLMPPMRSELANYYRMEIIKKPASEVFLNGWLNRAYGNYIFNN